MEECDSRYCDRISFSVDERESDRYGAEVGKFTINIIQLLPHGRDTSDFVIAGTGTAEALRVAAVFVECVDLGTFFLGDVLLDFIEAGGHFRVLWGAYAGLYIVLIACLRSWSTA